MEPPYTAKALLSKGLVHLNGHEQSPLPCLCARCIDAEVESVVVDGSTFVLRHAVAQGRLLFYWMPQSLTKSERRVQRAVEARLIERLRK